MATIFKTINEKTSTWCVKLIRMQEIIFFLQFLLYRPTNCPTEAEKLNIHKWVNWLRRAKRNQIHVQQQFPFLHYCGWHLRKQRKIKVKNSYVKIKLKARNQIISSPRKEILLRLKRDESGQSNLFRDQSYFNCVISAHLFLFSFVL